MARRTGIALLLALALLAAGCGVRNSKPYTAAGSASCFRSKGFTGVSTQRLKVGFIAAFSPNGGLVAKSREGNFLTIAFAADESGAAETAAAYKRRAPKSLRPHMADILETQRNAVLVWTVTPSSDDSSSALGCLHS